MSPPLLNLPFVGPVRVLDLPGPADALELIGRTRAALDDAIALVPRMTALLGAAESLVAGAAGLMERIELTRQSADVVTVRAEALLERSGDLMTRFEAAQTRLVVLLDALEPSLLRLQPTLERLAETTDPAEVDALVQLIDHLPGLVGQLERDVLPIMTTLGSVAPDLHDLLDVSRELNEMLGKVPGLGWIKKRVDEEQADREAERAAGRAEREI